VPDARYTSLSPELPFASLPAGLSFSAALAALRKFVRRIGISLVYV
jgi:hypothetical protein